MEYVDPVSFDKHKTTLHDNINNTIFFCILFQPAITLKVISGLYSGVTTVELDVCYSLLHHIDLG